METAVTLWCVHLFIIASGQSMDTRETAINSTIFLPQAGSGLERVQQETQRMDCIPKKACKYAGGHCVRGADQCDGIVIPRGCKGGKGCKCCITVCKDNHGSVCVDRQPYYGDCPGDMHFAQGSCKYPDKKICCTKNLWCGNRLTIPSARGHCYRTESSTDGGCPMPLFPQVDQLFPCSRSGEQGMSCCKEIPDRGCFCDRWGYGGRCGERGWSQFCSDFCAGSMQSPINLYQQRLADIPGHEFIYTNYDVVPDYLTCQNDGHYAKCYWNSTEVPTISGGNLTGTYIFDNMHWHIGCEDGAGSDHTVRNESYSGELHLVHYKTTFDNFSMALNSGDRDALAVLGVFLQVDGTHNPVYDAISESLVNITLGGENTTFLYNHTLSEFLPTITRHRPFYRYYGSLTHPPCNEVVVWTVFLNPSFISNYQIRPFRCMKTGPFYGSPEPEGLPLCNNHRQIQPQNGRKVTLWVVLGEEP